MKTPINSKELSDMHGIACPMWKILDYFLSCSILFILQIILQSEVLLETIIYAQYKKIKFNISGIGKDKITILNIANKYLEAAWFQRRQREVWGMILDSAA
jgi:hypothetical protein